MFRPLFVVLAAAFMASATQAAQNGPAGHYVEAGAALRTDAEVEAWYGMAIQLRSHFDEICGDTFCEGDYSNLQPLRFQCSVEARSRRIGVCIWSFAGSQESVDPATGHIAVQPGFWQCRMPLAPRTTLDRLLVALNVPQPLYAALPGAERTVLDGLIDCL